MRTLTRRQAEILEYLRQFIPHHGYAPSLEEIGQRFHLSSLATVHKHLENLRMKGYITRAWNRSRSLMLTSETTGECPYCHRPFGETDAIISEKTGIVGESVGSLEIGIGAVTSSSPIPDQPSRTP